MKQNQYFYSSNFDKHFIPEEDGWYVQYKTESGDEDAIKVDRQPKNLVDALEMLNIIAPDEIFYVKFYARIEHEEQKYSHSEVEKLLIQCKNKFGGSNLEDYVSDQEVIDWFNKK